MDSNKETGEFSYSYSAEERKEICAIRDKYTRAPESEGTIEKLRRLDRSVYNKASAASITVGVVGTLLFGFGFSTVMTDILAFLGNTAIIIGVVCALVGIAIASLAYPIYNLVTRNERERIAPEVIRLSDELIGE